MTNLKDPTELETMCKAKRDLTRRCDDLLAALKLLSTGDVTFKPYASIENVSVELPVSQALSIFELELHRKTAELASVTEALNRAEAAMKPSCREADPMKTWYWRIRDGDGNWSLWSSGCGIASLSDFKIRNSASIDSGNVEIRWDKP